MRHEIINWRRDAAAAPFLLRPVEDEAERFRHMRDAFRERHPRINGCSVALSLCSVSFGIPVHVLQGKDRSGTLGTTRAKLMALSRIVSLDAEVVNSWSGIGRVFHRAHSNVIYSVDRYGPLILAALEKSK